MARVNLELQPHQLLAQWKRCGMTADWLASYLSCELAAEARAAATNVLSTVINELLENAVKFSSDAAASIRVAVERQGASVRIETWNRALEGRASLLEETLAELQRGSAQALFLKRTAHPAAAGGPGIGIIIMQRDHGACIQASVANIEAGTADVHVRADLGLLCVG